MTRVPEKCFRNDDANSSFIVSKALSHHVPVFIFPFILCLLPTDEKERWEMLSKFSALTELIHAVWRRGLLVLIQWYEVGIGIRIGNLG